MASISSPMPRTSTPAPSTTTTTSATSQGVTPLRVKFARPTCFCGFTAVSIYPEPTSIGRQSRSSVASALPGALKTTNWVYECHFSPKQRGMAPPDLCEDCEKDRQRRATRGRLLARNTKDLSWFNGPPSADGPTTCKRHKALIYDQVELWPRKSPVSTTTITTTRSPSVVGADIHTDTTYLNSPPMDGHKVCGFHMHALEWHHMQTLSVDQILKFAKNASCDVFHLSVIRWLGDLAHTTTIKNCGIDRNYHLGLKLFQKVRCFCKKDAAMAKGPGIATLAVSTPSSLLFPSSSTVSNRTRSNNHHNNKHNTNTEYFIMCAGRVYDNHSAYEMVPQHGEDSYYSYNIRSWVKKSGGLFQCTFQLPLQKAIFTHRSVPIHSRIYANDWLSQWLEPTPFTPQTRSESTSSSSPGAFWFQRTSELLMTVRDSTSTTTAYVASRVDLQSPLIPTTPQPSSPSTVSRGLATSSDVSQAELTQSTRLLTEGGQAQEQDRFSSVTELQGLDEEMRLAILRHNAVVDSIKKKTAVSLNQSQEQDRYIKEINMDAFSSITMLLCDKCQDSDTRNFYVAHRAGSSPPPPPPLLSFLQQPKMNQGFNRSATTSASTTARPAHLTPSDRSDNETGFAPEVPDLFDLFDLLDPSTESFALDAELEEVNRDLERTLARHAQVFERTMEVRSRLVPDFLFCRGCCYRQAGVDVLPCHHHFLCADCVEKIEFYLVPYVVGGE